MRHYKCPALPRMDEKAIEILRAHLIALVRLFP
jgi:hypothetical protein